MIMKIFRTNQIRELDAQTIEMENIASINLMDRAASALFQRINKIIKPTDRILILAGPGNNGGDALAIARLFTEAGIFVHTVLCTHSGRLSADAQLQYQRLSKLQKASLQTLKQPVDLEMLPEYTILIDGLFGSGLNRPLEGFFAEIARWVNRQKAFIIALDLPSGLFGEDNRLNSPSTIIRADLTLGLEFPRLAFLLAENEPYIGKWEIIEIAINPEAIARQQTPFYFTTINDIRPILKKRSQYAHKGSFGKVLLVAGSATMTGAAILASRGALRSGAGLVFLRTSAAAVSTIQIAVPEILVQSIEADPDFSNIKDFAVVGIGPGLGTNTAASDCLKKLLQKTIPSLVLDADALNLLSKNRDDLGKIPSGSILTPHPKEFDRLYGETASCGYDRLEKALSFAQKHHVYILLKGAYTACITPDGQCFFNSTGNPGMATGGSGDVLTGIVVSLLSQGYSPLEACRLGVFLHGRSGDLTLRNQSHESLIASDLIEHLGEAFNSLK
jgi:ADP-dependent NAD(P)H-hydrate dehydratase / NAD(P)H-hydrate epimerase